MLEKTGKEGSGEAERGEWRALRGCGGRGRWRQTRLGGLRDPRQVDLGWMEQATRGNKNLCL